MDSLVKISRKRVVKACDNALIKTQKRRDKAIGRIADRLMSRAWFKVKCRACAIKQAGDIYFKESIDTCFCFDFILRGIEADAYRLLAMSRETKSSLYLDYDDLRFVINNEKGEIR